MWREIEEQRKLRKRESAGDDAEPEAPKTKTVNQAIVQIVVADLSMSLDNVLAGAGIARTHTWVLVVGLVLSVAFMGLAASYIAKLLERHHWIAYVGLLVILYVAVDMIGEGLWAIAEMS